MQCSKALSYYKKAIYIYGRDAKVYVTHVYSQQDVLTVERAPPLCEYEQVNSCCVTLRHLTCSMKMGSVHLSEGTSSGIMITFCFSTDARLSLDAMGLGFMPIQLPWLRDWICTPERF